MNHDCERHAAGNPTCYQHCGCRCDPCRHGQFLDRKRRRAKHARNEPPHVSAAPIVRHLERCLAAGMSVTDIGTSANYSRSEMRDMLNGKQLRLSRACAGRLMAVTPGGPEHARIDGTGTRRRLQALARMGWTWLDLAPLLGVTRSAVGQFADAKGTVYASTAARIAAVYEQVWSQPREGWTAERARRAAEGKGWPPPMAWDLDIDEPDAKAHTAEGNRIGMAAAEVAHLLGSESAESIAARLGYLSVDNLANTVANRDKPLADKLRATQTMKAVA